MNRNVDLNAAHSFPADNLPPQLNSGLDRAELAQGFSQRERIHIPRILKEESARRLFYALERETPWSITFNEGDNHLEFPDVLPLEQQKMTMAAWHRARSSFQFFYHHHRLTGDGEPYPFAGHYLAQLVTFLTSTAFLQFARDVTGLTSIARISAQATLYKPLNFLTIHDDMVGTNRLAAYVLNMTPNWRPDWGGALQFFDRNDHIEEGYLPAFNALNIFRVPKLHAVSQVAPFGGSRYSIAGWFLSCEH